MLGTLDFTVSELWAPFNFSESTTLEYWLVKICNSDFHPNMSMHILHTVLYTFPKVLAGRMYSTIKSFF